MGKLKCRYKDTKGFYGCTLQGYEEKDSSILWNIKWDDDDPRNTKGHILEDFKDLTINDVVSNPKILQGKWIVKPDKYSPIVIQSKGEGTYGKDSSKGYFRNLKYDPNPNAFVGEFCDKEFSELDSIEKKEEEKSKFTTGKIELKFDLFKNTFTGNWIVDGGESTSISGFKERILEKGTQVECMYKDGSYHDAMIVDNMKDCYKVSWIERGKFTDNIWHHISHFKSIKQQYIVGMEVECIRSNKESHPCILKSFNCETGTKKWEIEWNNGNKKWESENIEENSFTKIINDPTFDKGSVVECLHKDGNYYKAELKDKREGGWVVKWDDGDTIDQVDHQPSDFRKVVYDSKAMITGEYVGTWVRDSKRTRITVDFNKRKMKIEKPAKEATITVEIFADKYCFYDDEMRFLAQVVGDKLYGDSWPVGKISLQRKRESVKMNTKDEEKVSYYFLYQEYRKTILKRIRSIKPGSTDYKVKVIMDGDANIEVDSTSFRILSKCPQGYSDGDEFPLRKHTCDKDHGLKKILSLESFYCNNCYTKKPKNKFRYYCTPCNTNLCQDCYKGYVPIVGDVVVAIGELTQSVEQIEEGLLLKVEKMDGDGDILVSSLCEEWESKRCIFSADFHMIQKLEEKQYLVDGATVWCKNDASDVKKAKLVIKKFKTWTTAWYETNPDISLKDSEEIKLVRIPSHECSKVNGYGQMDFSQYSKNFICDKCGDAKIGYPPKYKCRDCEYSLCLQCYKQETNPLCVGDFITVIGESQRSGSNKPQIKKLFNQ